MPGNSWLELSHLLHFVTVHTIPSCHTSPVCSLFGFNPLIFPASSGLIPRKNKTPGNLEKTLAFYNPRNEALNKLGHPLKGQRATILCLSLFEHLGMLRVLCYFYVLPLQWFCELSPILWMRKSDAKRGTYVVHNTQEASNFSVDLADSTDPKPFAIVLAS